MPVTPGQFKLTRSGPLTETLTVNLQVGGTATSGVDYQALPNVVVFPAGAANVFLDVIPIADSINEATETVTLTVTSGSGYIPCSPSAATINIIEVSAVVVTVIASDPFVSELITASTPNNGQFMLTRTGDTTTYLTVNVLFSGTATPHVDYYLPPSTVVFAAGSQTATVNVAAIADDLPEQPETIILTVAPGTGYEAGAQNAATVTVLDRGGTVLNVEFASNFNDTSPNALTPVVYGNPQISTGLGRYGNNCGTFDGTNNFLVFPHEHLRFTGDFTIQTWAYLVDLEDRTLLSSSGPGDTNVKIFRLRWWGGAPQIYVQINGELSMESQTLGGFFVTPSASPRSWLHLALCRKDGVVRLFVMGQQVAIANWTGSFYCNVVGKPFLNGANDISLSGLVGRFSDLRFSITALYTSNFSPPHSFSPVYYSTSFSNVLMLLKGDGENGSTNIVDSSSKALSITRVGAPDLSTSNYKHGGSAIRLYATTFDQLWTSSSDADFDFGVGDFWIETWYRSPVGGGPGAAYIYLNALFGLTDTDTSGGWMNNTIGVSIDFWYGLRFFVTGANNTRYEINNGWTAKYMEGLFFHVAVARVGPSLASWVNGELADYTHQGGTQIAGVSAKKPGSLLSIGPRIRTSNGAGFNDGHRNAWFDDLRIVKGTVPWGLKNFTPPQAHPIS